VRLFRPVFPGRSEIVDRLHRVRLGLYALASLTAGWTILNLLSAPGSEEYQVAEALGCRHNYPILVLHLVSDGRFRWPEGDTLTAEQTIAMIPVWCAENEDGIVAVLARRDAKLSDAQPVLQAAREIGHTRVILATDDLSPLARAATNRLTSKSQ